MCAVPRSGAPSAVQLRVRCNFDLGQRQSRDENAASTSIQISSAQCGSKTSTTNILVAMRRLYLLDVSTVTYKRAVSNLNFFLFLDPS